MSLVVDGSGDGGWATLLCDAATTTCFSPLLVSGATSLTFDTISPRGMSGRNEVCVVDGPIEEVMSGMPGSQLKMILSELLHEKTYPLPCLSRAALKD